MPGLVVGGMSLGAPDGVLSLHALNHPACEPHVCIGFVRVERPFGVVVARVERLVACVDRPVGVFFARFECLIRISGIRGERSVRVVVTCFTEGPRWLRRLMCWVPRRCWGCISLGAPSVLSSR